MTVAYQKGLEKTAAELKNQGYDVVPWERASFADALIYHYEQGEKPVITASMNLTETPAEGMLYVNVSGLSTGQVNEILQRRRYTPLFD